MNRIRRHISTIAAVAFGAAALAATPHATPQASAIAYTVESDIVYGSGAVDGGASTTDLLLDLYIPALPDGQAMPLMILIHGGGFTGGDKTGNPLVASAPEYAERGYLVASINYRLLGEDPVPSARMRPMLDALGGGLATDLERGAVSAVDDTVTALEFLHRRDDVIVDQTILWGRSAGAITSLMTGYVLDDYGIERPPVAAVIDFWGGLYGTGVGNPFDDPTNDPALFIAHGTADGTVPYIQTEVIVDLLADAGGPTNEVHTIVGGGHGLDIFATDTSDGRSLFDASLDFIHENVLDVPRVEAIDGPVVNDGLRFAIRTGI